MNPLDKLIQHFEKFPGVGARQAKRFAFHVLRLSENESQELSKLVAELQGSVHECESCRRYFVAQGTATLCGVCSSPNRDHARLLVVERDSDIDAIERAGVYDGLYFVFGGTVPLLNATENQKLRGGAFKALVETRAENGLSEVILGFSVNPDGENTARFAESIIKEITEQKQIKISHLGRGLSTGSELEYADADTIKNALHGRT